MKIISVIFVFLINSLVYSEEKESANTQYLKAAAVPAFSVNPDNGFGLGLTGSIYLQEEGFKPYRSSFSGQFFMTVKNVHSHYLQADFLKPFDANMRLTTKLAFFSSVGENYCGKGASPACLLNSDIDHYYQYRIISGFLGIYTRWMLYEGPAKWELMTNYRGNYIYNGDFKEKGPYKKSLYDKELAEEKKDGYLSTLEVGLMVDARDHEAAPTTGYWLEGSLRGGSKLWGSAWNFMGMNLSARFYAPLESSKRVVLASQTIFDGVIGDLPWAAISKIGGSQSIDSYGAIGGQYIGRGMRDQLHPGKIKLTSQLELRYTFLKLAFLKQDFDFTAVLLGDAGIASYDQKRLSDLKNIFVGFGGGLRIHWNKNFIIRADFAFSPREEYATKFYLVVGNVF